MQSRIPLLTSLVLIVVFSLVSSTKAEKLQRVIPLASELAGYRITEGPTYYNRVNLWQYINGSAPGYLAYGFKEMVTFIVLHQGDNHEIVIDIYNMGTSQNAFGIFSVERPTAGRDIALGVDGFQSEATLFFWQDTYYVKLSADEVTPQTTASLPLLAQIIAQKIPQKGERPRLFAIFPKKGQVQKSQRYLRRDVLGQDYFTNGYSIDYHEADHKYQILLINAENSQKAKQNFQKYFTFLKTVAPITPEQPTPGLQAFAGTHNYYGKVFFARQGAYIIGALGLDNQQAARDIISAMFVRLTAITSKENQ